MISPLGHKRPVILRPLVVTAQILVYIGLFLCAEQLVIWLHLPLPANLVGLLLLLVLITTKALPINWVRAGSQWLLAEMLLFFVPAVVAVVNYSQMLRIEGWRIACVIALSTLLVLGVTAWVVQVVYRYELAREAAKQSRHE